MEHYRTHGTCSQEIDFEIEDNKIQSVEFIGGCDGNTKGLAALLQGMDVDEAIKRLSGIRCGFKETSCPDQLSRALREYQESH